MTINKKLQLYINIFIICGIISTISAQIANYAVSKYLNDYINLAWINYMFHNRQQFYTNNRNMPSKDIIVVLFDDDTDRNMSTFWPYDRSEIAKIIEYLRMSGSKAIIFDILFSDPKIEKPNSDKLLVEAVKKAGNVYLGAKFIISEKEDKTEEENTKMFTVNLEELNHSKINQRSNYKYIFDTPFIDLLKVVKGVGYFNTYTQKDVLRNATLTKCNDKACFPSLPFSYYLDFLNTKKIKLIPDKYFQIKDNKIPLGKEDIFYVNWFGGREDLETDFDHYKKFIYTSIPAWKLIKSQDRIATLARKLNRTPDQVFYDWYYDKDKENTKELIIEDPDSFKDKVVFVGVSSSGAQDYITTPFGKMPGVYLHAFILDSLISKNFIVVPNFIINLLILIFLCLLNSFTVVFASAKDKILLLFFPIFYLVLFSLLCLYLFGNYNIILDWSTPIIGIIISSFVAFLYYFLIEGKDKKLVKRAMSNYLSPQVMKSVLENPELLKPTAITRKTLTIFFFDIRSFTSISEDNPPELVAKMLNEYHSEVINVVFKNKGTLDKIIGDAVLSFWNAPIEIEDHPYLAVKSALEINERLKELNYTWEKILKVTINFGMGINTQDVVVGNIGSEKFMDYTVVGDGVNLASRLEGLNKNYNTNIIISEYTYRFIKDKVNVKFLDTVKVRGKTQGTNIYELLSLNVDKCNEMEGNSDEKI